MSPILDLARECGAMLLNTKHRGPADQALFTELQLTAFVQRIEQRERERCIAAVEGVSRHTTAIDGESFYIATGQCAAAIRSLPSSGTAGSGG